MAEALAGEQGLAAIHIVSHGSEGRLNLGATVLDAAGMQGLHREQLETIGRALSPDGDIMIYGCDFAAGRGGRAAAAILASVTGADVAASDNLTGSAALGGDWRLEENAGAVEARVAIDLGAQIAWQHVLAPNLVVNGDFTATTANWTGTGVQARSLSFFGISATPSPTGGNIAELEGTAQGTPGDTNAISQVIATTAGETYVFSTDSITRYTLNTGDRIMFIADGSTLSTVTTTSSWARYFTSFTAAAASTTIKLQSAGSVSGTFSGVDDTGGGLVDNVQAQELTVTPTGPLSAVEDTQATFTGFDVATNATGSLTVTLSAGRGVLTLAGTTGLTFTVGDGTADTTMTFSGTGSAISTALATLRYTGKANVNGSDTITQTVTLGATTDTDTVAVNIAAVNDAPVAANDTAWTSENQAATGNVLTNDSDIDGNALSVTQFVWVVRRRRRGARRRSPAWAR